MPNFSIEVFNQESFEQALRRFSTKTRKSGILRELKKNRFYTKPSVQKKMDKIKSIRRQKKAERLAALAASGGATRGRKPSGRGGRGSGGGSGGGGGGRR